MPNGQLLRIDNIDLPFEHTDLRGKRYLYHYTKAQTALGSILKDRRLRLSPHSDLNDPKEARNWVISVAGKADGAREFKDIWQAMENVKAKTRVLCLTSDGYDLRREPFDIADYWDARGFGHPTMWAHYAENHRGIALVFDRQRLLANAVAVLKSRSQLHYGHVSYRMPDETDGWAAFSFQSADWTTSQPIDQCVQRHLERHRKWLFFTKHPDWSSEQECRIVAYGDLARHEFVSIDGALVTIIYGDLASSDTKAQCVEFGAKLGADVMRVEWHSGRPHLMHGGYIAPGGLMELYSIAQRSAVQPH